MHGTCSARMQKESSRHGVGEGRCGRNLTDDKKAHRAHRTHERVTCGAVHFENIIRFPWEFIAIEYWMNGGATELKAMCFLWRC